MTSLHRTRRRLLAVVVAVTTSTVTLLPVPAGAQPVVAAAPLPAPIVTPTRIVAGGLVVVQGSGCPFQAGARTQVTVSLRDPAGAVDKLTGTVTATPAADGTWTAHLSPTVGAAAGRFRVEATCATQPGGTPLPYRAAVISVTASTSTPWTASPLPVLDVPNGVLWDIDCVRTTACTAVGSAQVAGVASPLAETWDGTTWTTGTVPVPAGIARMFLQKVSCASATRCAAVADASDGTRKRPVAAVWSSGVWTSTVLPTPPDAPDTTLTDVSCPTATVCVAVGTVGVNPSQPVAYRWQGTRWTALTAPPPVTGGSIPTGVSCPSVQFCVAVGRSYPGGSLTPLVDTFDGTTWTPAVLPSGTATTSVYDVDCVAVGSCTAVGGQILTLAGGVWTIEPGGSGLSAVSCAAATRCAAIGSGRIARQTGTGWSTTTLPSPTLRDTRGVACTGSRCVVVGPDGNYAPTAQHDLGDGVWVDEHPALLPGFVGAFLESVACGAPDACLAVGSLTSASGQPLPLAYRWDGAQWTREALPDTGNGDLTSVTCASRNTCLAVGYIVAANGFHRLASLVWRAGTWRVVAVPSGQAQFTAVSCLSQTSCLATLRSRELSPPHATRPGLLAFDGRRWNLVQIPTTPPLPFYAQTQFPGLSCVANGSCHLVVTTAGDPPESIDVRWDGTAWTRAPMPPAASISCRSDTECVATPAAGSLVLDGYGGYVAAPRAAVLQGTTWTTEPVPADPPNHIACSAHRCVAAAGYAYLVERRAGVWTHLAVGPSSLLSAQLGLNAVACPSDTTCVAVGVLAARLPVVVMSPPA